MIMRPKQFYLMSLALLLVALSFPVQAAVLYGHQWGEWGAIFNKVTSMNWLVISCLVLTSYLHLKASRWLYYAVPGTIVLVAANNYYVGDFAGDYSMGQTLWATTGFSLLFAPLFMPSSQIVLKDPKRRWWMRSKRYYRRISTTLNPFVGGMIHSHTFDVSSTGAFISFNGLEEKQKPKVGDRIRVTFNVNSMRKIRCEAVVVRHCEARGRYPEGLGLRFIDFDKVHHKTFQKLIRNTPKELLL